MTYKKIIVVEIKDGKQILVKGHNARVNGQMAEGTKTWEFDEMEEDGVYIGRRDANYGRLYLVRQ